MAECTRCHQECDLRPLPTSEVVQILAEAVETGDDLVALHDLISSRARSSTARLQVGVWAVIILARVAHKARTRRLLAAVAQVEALEELFGAPSAEEPDR
jgi:hypothetical protein